MFSILLLDADCYDAVPHLLVLRIAHKNIADEVAELNVLRARPEHTFILQDWRKLLVISGQTGGPDGIFRVAHFAQVHEGAIQFD
jgi:hypothetical protein